MMVTDPPYGVEYDPSWRVNTKKMVGAVRARGNVKNDETCDWREAWRLFGGDIAYVWHAGKFASVVQASLESCDFEIRSQIVWAKQHFAISRGNYHWQHEPCWYAVRKGKPAKFCKDRTQTTLWEIASMNCFGGSKAEGDSFTGHGTQKPFECMARPIRNHNLKEIYDPFVGSGTTIIACEKLGRKCYAMELDPRYVDVVVARWEKLAGKKAERIKAK